MIDTYKSLSVISDFLHKSQDIEEMLKLIYVLKAWQTMDTIIKVEDESLTFESFYNQKIDLNKLQTIFKKLAKNNKLFQLYHFQPRYFQLNEIENIITYIAKNELPSITLTYFDEKLRGRKGDFSVSHQISELGIKLLGDIEKELYVPFTNGFAYSYYTDKKIYAENKFTDNELLSEIINILEDKEIEFVAIDPLKYPSFTEHNTPHILKQFDKVLSFPPFGMRGKVDINEDKFHRFNFHRGANLDVAHFEHILSQTKSKAVILLPVGFTFRGSYEEKFREYLIDNNLIEAIIQLPPNLHSATSIQTTFFVINKNKQNDKVFFINLQDDSFITRSGRSLVFKSLDEIIDIYSNQKEIENISILVSKEEIAKNNYILSIDRYVIPLEAKKLQKLLEQFELVKLEDIAEIRRSQLFKDEEVGKEVYELSPSDFNSAGFTIDSKRIKKIDTQYRKLQTYKLQPYDVLLSTKGTIGKVGIIGETTETLIASQAIQVIRLSGEDMKEKAISLYMFFKSELAQTVLSSRVAGAAMPQISTNEIKNLEIPVLNKQQRKQLVSSFEEEVKLYSQIDTIENKINSIHKNFLGENR